MQNTHSQKLGNPARHPLFWASLLQVSGKKNEKSLCCYQLVTTTNPGFCAVINWSQPRTRGSIVTVPESSINLYQVYVYFKPSHFFFFVFFTYLVLHRFCAYCFVLVNGFERFSLGMRAFLPPGDRGHNRCHITPTR